MNKRADISHRKDREFVGHREKKKSQDTIFLQSACNMIFKPTTNFILIWDFLMFNHIFLLTQSKQCTIITDKHGI